MSSTEERVAARRFGLGALLALLLLATWLWRRRHPALGAALGGVGALLGATGLVRPAATLAVRRVWMRLGHLLGAINGVVLLTVIFFAVLTPIAAVRRLFRPTPKPRWEPREPRPPDHFDHPF